MTKFKVGTVVRLTGCGCKVLTMDATHIEIPSGALAVVRQCPETHGLYTLVGFDGRAHQWIGIEPYWEVVDVQEG